MTAHNDAGASESGRSAWRTLVRRAGLKVEDALEFVDQRLESRFRPSRPVQVVVYRTFGNRHRATVRGRVLYKKGGDPLDTGSAWQRLQATYRRFETDEIAGVTVRILVGGESCFGVTDEEGYFLVEVDTPEHLPDPTFSIAVDLPAFPEALVQGSLEIFVASSAALFGVISDIDDTVLITEATSILKMMRLTLLGSPESRVAFPGVVELYERLHAGINPFFYVSSSPWNLYDFLEDFFDLKELVRGPFLLRDFGYDLDKLVAGSHRAHKEAAIKSVLASQADLGFVLIGDAGQDDAAIYEAISEAFPQRVMGVYLRWSGQPKEKAAAGPHLDAIRRLGIQAELGKSTMELASFMAGGGLISPQDLPAIGAASLADAAALPAFDRHGD